MGQPQISYGTGPTVFTFERGPQNFIAEDAPIVHDNLSTSGFRERVFESNNILISFTMPGLLVGDDFATWKNFYAWALQGGSFLFTPNLSVLDDSHLAPFYPWVFSCVLEDQGFKPKRVGFYRYSIDCKFRTVPGAWPQPANSGVVMDAFMNAAGGAVSSSTQ